MHLGIDNWRSRVDACIDHDELLLTVTAYLGYWQPQDINRLPIKLTAPIRSIDELHHRAIELIQAETTFRGSNADWTLLGDLAMVMTAAAKRASYLDLHAGERVDHRHRRGSS